MEIKVKRKAEQKGKEKNQRQRAIYGTMMTSKPNKRKEEEKPEGDIAKREVRIAVYLSAECYQRYIYLLFCWEHGARGRGSTWGKDR